MSKAPALRRSIVASAVFGFPLLVSAAVTPDLPYPSGTPSADEIANQVYFVNHFYALKNYSIQKVDDDITVILTGDKGETPLTLTVERFLNNDYSDGTTRAKDLAIFRSGKLRGTGMLIEDYVDDEKSQSYMIWLPALRKIRRFGQPAHDDAWGGTDFTFGDVTLRKPRHENHTLLGTETFNDCLGFMQIAEGDRNKYTKDVPTSGSCEAKGKQVYKLKSCTKFESWWYDCRIGYIDTKSFSDYRTEYFKGDKKIKTIDRDWRSLNMSDPRANTWAYWYGRNEDTGHETWAVIPKSVVRTNDASLEADLWTESTLRRLKK